MHDSAATEVQIENTVGEADPAPGRLLSDSLAVRLLRSVFGAYFIVTVLVTAIQLGVEYRHAQTRLTRDIAAMERTFGPGIADAVWGLNEEVVSGILSGMIALPQVVGVRIVDERGAQVAALGLVRDDHGTINRIESSGTSRPVRGHAGFFDTILEQKFALVHTDPHRVRQVIGQWTVYSNRQIIMEQIEDEFTILVFNAMLKTAALWFIFLVVIRRVIGRPLRQLSAYVDQLNIDNLGSAPLLLTDRGRHELHALAGILNRMTGKIRRSVEENAQLLHELQESNENLQSRVEERTYELQLMATTDGMTGLFNRRKLDEILAYEQRRVARFGGALSLIICDIDHFKSVNDTHGHQAGDLVLMAFSHLLRASVRLADTVGRWGGEEFLIVCPQTSLDDARLLAERLRHSIATATFPVVGTKTCSFGLAQMAPGETAEEIVRRADAALYIAKQSGRNQVAAAEIPA